MLKAVRMAACVPAVQPPAAGMAAAKGFRGLLRATLLLPVALFAVQAQAWTFTTAGTIGSGTDYTGMFFAGIPTDLAGATFTLATTIDPSLFPNQLGDPYGIDAYGAYTSPFVETLTINGLTRTFELSPSGDLGKTVLANELTQGQGYGTTLRDLANQDASGFHISHNEAYSIYSTQHVSSTKNAFGLGLGYDQAWSYKPGSGDSQEVFFLMSDVMTLDTLLQFSVVVWSSPPTDPYASPSAGSISCVSINDGSNCSDSAAVPEPDGLALIAGALLSLTAAQRRRAPLAKRLARSDGVAH